MVTIVIIFNMVGEAVLFVFRQSLYINQMLLKYLVKLLSELYSFKHSFFHSFSKLILIPCYEPGIALGVGSLP